MGWGVRIEMRTLPSGSISHQPSAISHQSSSIRHHQSSPVITSHHQSSLTFAPLALPSVIDPSTHCIPLNDAVRCPSRKKGTCTEAIFAAVAVQGGWCSGREGGCNWDHLGSIPEHGIYPYATWDPRAHAYAHAPAPAPAHVHRDIVLPYMWRAACDEIGAVRKLRDAERMQPERIQPSLGDEKSRGVKL